MVEIQIQAFTGASAKYKMWYGTSNEQTGLAISDDGINWTELGVVMTDGYQATVEYYPDGFAGARLRAYHWKKSQVPTVREP